MRSITQWFFIISSFIFLYWYMPEALKDDQVTLFEMSMIGINVLCFVVNFVNFFSTRFRFHVRQ